MRISFADAVALAWFTLCWFGYGWFAEWHAVRVPSLVSARRALIDAWVKNIYLREVRILDSTLLANLLQGSTFFASTTIVILGGLLALLGTTEKAINVVAELPFTMQVTERIWEIKILLLLAIFVYAFFKFTWSLRQYNLTSLMVGAMPEPDRAPATYHGYLVNTSLIASFAGENYNMGLRAYYFGVAALTWLLNPWLLIGVTTLVVAVLYQREFRSRTLKALLQSTDIANTLVPQEAELQAQPQKRTNKSVL